MNFDIILPDIPPQEDKITYPRASQTKKEKKREARIELKHKQKRLKKEKYLKDPAFSKAQNESASTNNSEEKNSSDGTSSGEGSHAEEKVNCTNNTIQISTS